ncbi:MAG: sigma-54 dependent transcriptional regulator [Acidobacteriota bacterium]|nr:sigma-54 dependent transcriptional regulator [Acidobacteriota bacterium]
MTNRLSILIVDDDESVTATLSMLLKQNGHLSKTASNPTDALAVLSDGDVDLVLQDMNFSRATTGEEGMELLREIKSMRPHLPVILITAWGSIALAVEGVKAGASDFVTKPWSNQHLLRSIETAVHLAEGVGETDQDQTPPRREDLDRQFDFSGLMGNDPQLRRILDLIGRVGPTDASVLVTGESGTGKELVAEALHRKSRRSDGPFVKVNLGGVSSTLFESEMFGHVRGAFTDARSDRSGRFEVAQAGTIFLDEIGELDLASQVKLLRVLQDRTYEVLGSSRTRTVDVRVISATNRDLALAVHEGGFREDLLYRLNLISIKLPALRERAGDIPLLARHFLDGCATAYGRGALALTDAATRWLQRQRWPGNVRQLKQTIERAVLVVDGDRIEQSDFETLACLEAGESARGTLPAPGSMTLNQLEREMISSCMQHYDGNISHVAEALGLSRAALYRRLEKYGLSLPG